MPHPCRGDRPQGCPLRPSPFRPVRGRRSSERTRRLSKPIRRAAWAPPYAIAARDRHQNSRLLEVQHDAVRAGNSIQQFFENAIGSQPVDLAAGILQSGLTLIGEIQIARTGKHQVVGAFEVLDLTSVYNARNGSTVWVEQQDALLVVGDKDTAVAMDLEAIRFTVIFDD